MVEFSFTAIISSTSRYISSGGLVPWRYSPRIRKMHAANAGSMRMLPRSEKRFSTMRGSLFVLYNTARHKPERRYAMGGCVDARQGLTECGWITCLSRLLVPLCPHLSRFSSPLPLPRSSTMQRPQRRTIASWLARS